MLTEELTTFKVKNEEFIVVPKMEFLRLKRDYSVMEKEEFPKIYNEVDEEWTWETIDFGPEWVDPKELLLVHEELENGKKI